MRLPAYGTRMSPATAARLPLAAPAGTRLSLTTAADVVPRGRTVEPAGAATAVPESGALSHTDKDHCAQLPHEFRVDTNEEVAALDAGFARGNLGSAWFWALGGLAVLYAFGAWRNRRLFLRLDEAAKNAVGSWYSS